MVTMKLLPTANETFTNGHSRFSKSLPEPPPHQGWGSRENEMPPPVPSKSVHSTQSRSNFPKVRVRQSNISPPFSSDEDAPGLSHSWSDSSVEETDQLSDIKFVAFDHNAPSSTPSISPGKSTTVVLAERPLRSIPEPLLSPHSSSDSLTKEIWCRTSAGTNCELGTNELIVPLNRLDIPQRKKQELSKDKLTLRSDVRRKFKPSHLENYHSDLMGNKLAKLKSKSLGDFSSNSGQHEDAPKNYAHETRAVSTYLDKAKSHISTSRNSTSSPFSPVNEKVPVIPSKYTSRLGISSTPTGSQPGSHSTITTSQSSRSTTRAPTIPTPPSSDTLTLQSDSTTYLCTKPSSRVDTSLPPSTSTNSTYPQKTVTPEPSDNKFSMTPSEQIILSGPPLNVIQLDCYQNHRSMRKSRNKLCPVGCMICQKKDTEMRWTCTWCFMSACASCTHILRSTPERNLRICLDKLAPESNRQMKNLKSP